ncbi:MAG: peptidylprolyl isomerase [Granulosicoccus sp.]
MNNTIRIILTLSMLCLAHSSLATDQTLDRIRAVVNEGVVLDSEVTTAVRFFRLEAVSTGQNMPSDDSVLEQRILDRLVEREVLRQHAARLGIVIDPGSVNRAVQQIARNNNLDSLRFRETLQKQGIDYRVFRQNIEDELLRQRLIEREVQARIRVSSQEIDDYVDAARNDIEEKQQYRIQHILLAVPAAATPEQLAAARQRAEGLLAQLNRGADFTQLAIAESDGARALQGGDLGWRTLQELPDFIGAQIRQMQPGDHSDIVSSANGLHLMRLAAQQSGDLTQQAETLARHIFIAGNDASIEQRLRDLRGRIRAGEPFAALARQFSEDPNSADNGGELPWFTRGQLPPVMEQVASSLAINEMSVPFQTQFGWHLLQVLDRRTRQIDEQALREQANQALRESKLEQEIQRWSRQLRDESYIEVRS